MDLHDYTHNRFIYHDAVLGMPEEVTLQTLCLEYR